MLEEYMTPVYGSGDPLRSPCLVRIRNGSGDPLRSPCLVRIRNGSDTLAVAMPLLYTKS